MLSGIKDVSRRALSSVLFIFACLALAVVLGFAAQAWAADAGVYAFICEGEGADYVLVVKNGTDVPDEGEYGATVKAYPQNLASIRVDDGWPWRATGATSTLDADAAQVKKVVVAGSDGSVSLSYAREIFRYFSSCAHFDLTGFYAEGYKSDTDPNFTTMFGNVYNASTNDDITVILGAKNVLWTIGLADGTGTLYRKIGDTYDIVFFTTVPTMTACTLYTKRPADCLVSPNLSDYDFNLAPDGTYKPAPDGPDVPFFVFDGTVKGAAGATVTLKDHPEIVVPSDRYTFTNSRHKWNGASWVANSNDSGVGHYRIRATAANNSGYTYALANNPSACTAWVEFDIIPGGTLELYSDASLETPVDGNNLNLTEATDLYVKCATALSGLEGTNEMKVDATSSTPSVLSVATPEKIGAYTDGYCVYKIRLSPVKEGTANISLWGYTTFSPSVTMIGTETTVLSAEVDVLPATLTLEEGAQAVLAGLKVGGDTVVVGLAYEGRDPESIGVGEVNVEVPTYTVGFGSYPNYTYEDFDLITASYDLATGKLSVTPEQTNINAIVRTGTLRITVPGAGLYGDATVEIPVAVSRMTPEVTLTLMNGQPLPQPLTLTPGQTRDIALAYSGEGMMIGDLISTDPAVAEITDCQVNSDGKGAVLTVRANAASASSVTLSVFVGSTTDLYRSVYFTFTVKVSKTDLPLSASPSSLELEIGGNGTAVISNDGDRILTAASSDEAVAQAALSYEDDGTIALVVEALSAGEATITVAAAETSALSASEATVQVTVTKAEGALSVSSGAFELKAGESATAEVSYEGDGAITAASSDEAVATATFDEDTMELTVEALSAGTATITISASETEASKAAAATVEVTVTAAGALSVSPSKLALKAGESATAEVSYEGDGAITTASSDEAVATATFDEDTMELSVDALSAGTAAITISAAATGASEAAKATVQVTVSAASTGGKEPAPELDIISTEYALIIGGASWKVQCGEPLQWEATPSSVIEVTSSNGSRVLTVSAKAKGIAILKLWAEETETTLALAPTYFLFTATKQVTELNTLSLQVGAKAMSTIGLLGTDGSPVVGAVSVTSADAQVATASYDTATGALTVLAVGTGETVIGLASEAATEDYVVKVAVHAPPPPPEVKVDTGATGVVVTSDLANIPAGATVEVTVRTVTSGGGYGTIVATANGKGKTPLGVYEVILTVDGQEAHTGFGSLTLAFPVDVAWEGKEVTVWHLHDDGLLTYGDVWVTGGKATIRVTDLSTFAVTVDSGSDDTDTDNTGTDNNSGTGTLVTGTGTTGSTGTSGTGTLVSGSGSSGSSGSSGTLGTSQSSAQNDEDTDASDDDGDTAVALRDTTTPMSATDAPGEATSSQQGAMNPWALAVLIGALVVAVGAAFWLFLRRRHRLATEAFAEV
jgi:predicted secreted protein